jgi:hypothetical protein
VPARCCAALSELLERKHAAIAATSTRLAAAQAAADSVAHACKESLIAFLEDVNRAQVCAVQGKHNRGCALHCC